MISTNTINDIKQQQGSTGLEGVGTKWRESEGKAKFSTSNTGQRDATATIHIVIYGTPYYVEAMTTFRIIPTRSTW
jgi:hypothetical protein